MMHFQKHFKVFMFTEIFLLCIPLLCRWHLKSLLSTSPRWLSVLCYVSVQCRREHVRRWCPSLLLPPRETSDHQSRCAAWSSPAWDPSGLLQGTRPRRSPAPRPWVFSGHESQNSLHYELSPSRCGWDSPGAGLWRKTFSGASPVLQGNPSEDPVIKKKSERVRLVCVFSLVLHSFMCMKHRHRLWLS